MELLRRGLRCSVGITGVNDLAMAKSVVLSIVGHCDVEAREAKGTKVSRASIDLSDERVPSKGDVGQ